MSNRIGTKKQLNIPHRLYACGASFRICPATAAESSTHVAHQGSKIPLHILDVYVSKGLEIRFLGFQLIEYNQKKTKVNKHAKIKAH